jgi:hypothetical protein
MAALLLAGGVGGAHAGMAASVPSQASAPSSVPDAEAAAETVTMAKEAAYRGMLARFDASEPSEGVASVIARCRFIGNYTEEDYGDWIASATGDYEACLERLRQKWAQAPEAQLYLYQQMWGEEAVAEGAALIRRATRWPASLRADLYATQSRLLDGLDQTEKAKDMALLAARLGNHERLPRAVEALLTKRDQQGAARLLREAPLATDAWTADRRLEVALKLDDARVALGEVKRYEGKEFTLDGALVARAHLKAGDAAAAHRALEDAGEGDDEAQARFDVALARADVPAAVAQIDITDTDRIATQVEWFAVLATQFPASVFHLPMLGMAMMSGGILLCLALLPMMLLVPVHYRGLARRVQGRAPAPLYPRIGLWHAWWAMALLLALPFLVAGVVEPRSLARLFTGDPLPEADAFFRINLWSSVASLLLLMPLAWQLGREALTGRIGVWRQVGWLLVALVLLYTVAYLQGAWLQWRAEDSRTLQTEAVERLLDGGASTYGPVLTFLLIAVLGPVVEELVFRGMLLGGMARHISFGWANLLQASLFATIHNDTPRFFFYFAMGLLAGFLVRRTRSLMPAIALHVINNGFFFLYAT